MNTSAHTKTIKYEGQIIDLSYITGNFNGIRIPKNVSLLKKYFLDKHKNKVKMISLYREKG